MKIGIEISTEALKVLQVLSLTHISICVTDLCPLQCAHCLVSAGDHSRSRSSLSREVALAIAAKMQELRERGVRRISLTGGEPTLVAETLQMLSEAAFKNGLETTVVTSAFFAESNEESYRLIKSFPYISAWHISSDVYHQAQVPRSCIVNAAEAAVRLGKKATVRMTVAKPIATTDTDLYNWLQNNLPEEAEIVVQPVIKTGRAEDLNPEIIKATVPGWPCITSGMAVRTDGSVSPCCAGLIADKNGHPFRYENVITAGITKVYDDWCQDPLLQLIQAVGFAPLLGWIKEKLPNHPVLEAVPEHPCECCLALWRVPEAVKLVKSKIENPAIKTKINTLYNTVFESVSPVGY
ncbi:MAG: radical SAM protein [Bacillota bacterium]|jgi:pyruvate-formate lyase-activating enzyme